MRAPSLPVIASLLAVLPNLSAWGLAPDEPSAFDAEAAIEYSQAAIGRQVGDYRFLDSERNDVRLADLQGKPLVVNLVYTACSYSCPLIVQTLYDAVEVAQDALGADSFAVLTIGFDTQDDTPARMRAFARSQGVDLPNWRFLSGDEATVASLSEDLGFIYFPSPRGFDHLAQTTVIDAEGVVYRHVYGADFTAPAVVEPLKDLVFGRRGNLTSVAGLINRVRLFCTFYDPASERYRFDYAIFIGAAVGSVSLMAIGIILLRAWLRIRRREERA
jgi:protein SCO1/2